MSDDRRKSLELLERNIWPSLDVYPTRLVQRCHELRKIPIGQLTVEDLRLLIGQQKGLEHLIPVALDVLREDPLAEGDLYPGDLMKNVLGVSEEYWKEHPEERAEILQLTEPRHDQLSK